MDKKNIDAKTITEALGKHKNAVINVVILLVACAISYKIYSVQQGNVNSLINKKDAEIKKNEMFTQVGALERKFSTYKKYVNKKDASSIISTLGNYAAGSAVEISAIKPAAPETVSVYERYPFALSLRAPDYHALGRFIAKLESSSDIYVVKSLVVRTVDSSAGKQEKKIGADLDMYTIFIKK